MKKYARLLLVPVVLGAHAAGYQTVLSPANAIVAELRPLLSPRASIVLPTDNETLFSDLTRRYMQVFQPDIAAVVRVGTESDVPLIVEYASKSGRAILTGSARHGWGLSLNEVRDAILIDITPLSTIVVNAATNTMTVGGGVTVGGVLAAVRAAGKESAAGVCDCVGFLGASLGGGHGRLQGLHGLMADNIISAHLVTAGGEMIEVSDASHPVLFWGLRGAGHNFGIVTEAVYRIYDETNGGLQFNAEITYGPEQLEALFAAIEGFAQPAETSMFVLFVPGPDMTPIIVLSFTSYSPEDSARSQLAAVFGHLPHLASAESIVPSDQMNTVGALGVGAAACKSLDRKNAFGASLTHYDIPTVRAVYTSYAAFLTATPAATGSLVLWETYAAQGVQAVSADDTAYPHREERHVVMLLAGYPDATLDSVAERWLRNSTAVLHANSGFERPAVYLNYAQGDEGVGAMYGYEQWRLDRLAALKREYDPWGMFSAYHPIPRE